MNHYRIFTTKEFDSDFESLDNSEKIRVKKILKQLKEKGMDVGKPLSGLLFFREKRFNGKRLYFLSYKEFYVILAIAISDKKAQQATINRILLDLVEYQKYVYETLKKDGII